MICKKCGKRMYVIDSRSTTDRTYRKYKCECGNKIFTEEKERPKCNKNLYRARVDKYNM